MPYHINILTEAEIDLDESYIWYESKKMNLGDSFFASINDSMTLIQNNPFLFEEVYERVRRCVVKRFPYGIYYRLLIDSNEIQVLGIIHFKRDSSEVFRRL
jgi:hypothetical protein